VVNSVAGVSTKEWFSEVMNTDFFEIIPIFL